MSASNPPVNGLGYITYIALQDMLLPGSYKANPSLASGDVQVSIDGGAFANLGTLPAVTPAAGVAVKVTLSAAEMTGDNIFVKFIDQTNPKEWADYAFTVQTVAAVWNSTTPPTVLAIADQVWDEAIAGHLGAGSTGLALNSAGAAGDPWATTIPGAYGAGTAGHRLGNIPDLVAGAAGGVFIAGANAATTVNITGNITGNLSGSVGSVSGAVGSVAGNVSGNVSGNVVGSVASVTADVGITQVGADKVWLSAARTLTGFGTLIADVADKLLGRNLAGGSDGGRTVQDALRILRNKRSITAGTLTVTIEDDATPAWTATVATAVSNPVSAIDPA